MSIIPSGAFNSLNRSSTISSGPRSSGGRYGGRLGGDCGGGNASGRDGGRPENGGSNGLGFDDDGKPITFIMG